MTDRNAQQQIRRNALLLGAVAVGVFVTFIAATVFKGGVAG